MDILFAVVATAVAVIVVLFVLRRRITAPGADPTQLTFDPSVMEEVRRLALDGRKIQAIALLREQSPTLSLGTAKTMVDRMEQSAHRTRSSATPDAARPARTEKAHYLDDVPSSAVIPLDVELEVRSLKAQDQAIAAIALVREHTGFGLREAKDYVDGL